MTVLKVRISGVFKKWSDVSLLGMKMLRFAFSLKCGAIFELLIGQKKKKKLNCKQLSVEEHTKGGSDLGIW